MMIDELRARFRTRFIDTARGRIRRALELIGDADGGVNLTTELHSLAGEAALLGLMDISNAARDGELAAKEWSEGNASAKLRCVRAVRTVSQRVEAFAAEPADPAPPAAAPAPTPAAPARVTLAAKAAPAPQKARKARATWRVLVIDDSELSGEQVTDALDEAGITAELAMDRAAALAALARFRPDAVLSDVNMPGIDLTALCHDLRHAAAGPLTVILLSSMSEDSLARRTVEVGADAYITKQRGTGHVVAELLSLMESPG